MANICDSCCDSTYAMKCHHSYCIHILVCSECIHITWAVCIRWTGLGTGLWDWTHRELRSSFLKARKQEIAERHYIAATVDNSLPSTRGVPTQLSPCRQPAVVLPCKTSSTSFRCEFVHDLTTTSRNTWRSLLANSRIPSVTTILQLLELFLCMLLPSLAGASVPAFRLPVL